MLVEAATAIAGTWLPDASGFAAVEQTVLQVHVPADRRPGRGEERLGVDKLAAPGAADAQRLLTFLFFFCFRFLCFVLFEVFDDLLQFLYSFLQSLLVGHRLERDAAQKAG